MNVERKGGSGTYTISTMSDCFNINTQSLQAADPLRIKFTSIDGDISMTYKFQFNAEVYVKIDSNIFKFSFDDYLYTDEQKKKINATVKLTMYQQWLYEEDEEYTTDIYHTQNFTKTDTLYNLETNGLNLGQYLEEEKMRDHKDLELVIDYEVIINDKTNIPM